MRLLHDEAIKDDDYCSKYYNPFHRITNRGGLCLISKPYFGVASIVMQRICTVVTIDNLREERQDFLSSVKNEILNDESLFEQFCAVELSNEDHFDDSCHLLPNSDKKDIFNELLSKAIHAKSGAVLKQFKDENVGNATDMALRQKLKASVSKSQIEKSIELKTQKQKSEKK